MTEGMEKSPTEILLYIFTFLTPKQLAKCRQVCWRWKHVVDNISSKDSLWIQHCKKDFPSIFMSAYYKRLPGLNWCNIYRSLAMWPKLHLAEESRDEFASAACYNDEIRSFRVLRHGIIGVHTRGAISYYDLETLKPSSRTSISGNYIRYIENDDTIIVQGYNLNLFIVRKLVTNVHAQTDITFGNVKTFMLANHELFFITLNNEVCLCNLNDEKLPAIVLNRAQNTIMSVGYSYGRLNLLTFDRNIYTLVGNELVYQQTLGSSANLLHELKKYNFLEGLDWRVYFQWMYVLRHSIPQGPLRHIIIIKTYGEAVFVGSNWGVLRIYYAPYQNNEFDIFNTDPVKQYNFVERFDCPVLSMCPILQIEVVECDDGHMILVAMPKKVAVLKYKHNFKNLTPSALVPYTDVDVRLLNMS